jgi:hypothetical protein
VKSCYYKGTVSPDIEDHLWFSKSVYSISLFFRYLNNIFKLLLWKHVLIMQILTEAQ